MLDERITQFVRNAVRIRSREFDQDLMAQLIEADTAAARIGQITGSARINGYARVCRRDLRNRAQYTFLEIQRALGLYPQDFDASLSGNLVGLQITEVRGQCTELQRLLERRLGGGGNAFSVSALGPLYAQLNDECEHLNEKYTLEIGAFMQAATQRSTKVSNDGGNVVIHGTVGIVQTGAYATSTLTLNVGADDRDAMLKALDLAGSTVADSQQLAAEHQRQMLEVVAHLREAVNQPRPNPSLIRGMFAVLCTTLQTLAAAEPAMAALRAAVLPFGITL